MNFPSNRLTRIGALLAIFGALSACGLPQVGPNKSEIYQGSVQKQGDAFVVTVNESVTRATAVSPALGFSAEFRNAAVVGSDVIQPGDILGLTVWENLDDGLLSRGPESATLLEELQVDGSGFIFVPYAGRIRAAGNSPEEIRRIITMRLEEQTPDPQVQVRRIAGDGSTVSLIGSVGAQGVYPIERPTRTLSTMLARAGGVTITPEVAQVTVIRGGMRSQVWFQDLYNHPETDIALRAGDRILVEEDTRAFTALGATGGQTRVPFRTQDMSAMDALAEVGGLQAATADPTGIFVFRNERAEVANAVLGRSDLVGDQRMIYLLDLTEPNGIFEARDFVIRDGDTVYVTEAPYTQFTKVLSALTGPITSVDSIASVASGY